MALWYVTFEGQDRVMLIEVMHDNQCGGGFECKTVCGIVLGGTQNVLCRKLKVIQIFKLNFN